MYYDEKLLYTEADYKSGNWTTAGIRVRGGIGCRGFLSLSWINNSWNIEVYPQDGYDKIVEHYVTNFDDAKKLFRDIYTAFYHAIENEYIYRIIEHMARFTATQIRWGHSERNEIYRPNGDIIVTTRLAFNRRYNYYYVSVYSNGVTIVPDKNAGTRIKEARQLFEKVSEAVSHAVRNEYIELP